tara:strand:- start:67773 stop:68633 length:861 start_codon:yes stop_codon:yes gene_type:complete
MSKLHLSPELALGYAELKFLTDSIEQNHKNLILADMKSYGVVQINASGTGTGFESFDQAPTTDDLFTAFKVVQGNGAAITVKAGTAIDQYGNVIVNPSDLNNLFTFTEGASSFTVTLEYEEDYTEDNTVNIQADGVVTFSAENITDSFNNRLRGINQFPSVIKFPNSTVNTGEYLVQAIVTDTQLILNVAEGVLQADTDQAWQIVGTFTPSAVIAESDKFPFREGQAKITLSATNFGLSTQQDLSVNFPGVIFLAVVTYNEGVLTIVDRRGSNLYKRSPYPFTQIT